MTKLSRMRSVLLTAVLGGIGTAVVPALAAPARSNAEVAFDFFRHKGFTKAQAAGIVGNLQQKSSVDPASDQAGGPGRGIAQWSVGGRWDTSHGDNLLWYARSQHASPHALNTQLNFVWYELEHFPGYGLQQLRAAKSVAAATKRSRSTSRPVASATNRAGSRRPQVTLRSYGG